MTLPRSTPSARGLDAAGLIAFLDAADSRDLGLHSLMVARGGHVVAEGFWAPYARDGISLVYSLSKTLTATTVGVLAGEGRLGLDDPVLAHFPEVDPGTVHPNWAKVTLRHCLSMTVGHEDDAWAHVFDRSDPAAATAGDDWLPRVFATLPVAEPGTRFAYNQVATYLLGEVARRVSGQTLVEAVRERVLDPLGAGDLRWHCDPLGRELGFSGAHVTTEAILSVAQLYLDRGVWEGTRLLDEAWVDAATVGFGPANTDPGADDDWSRGYGYSFWMQRFGYRGDGAYGQYLVVLPEHDVTVAITSEVARMQDTLDALWEHVVPAVGRHGSEQDDALLAERLAGLTAPPLRSAALGPEFAEFNRSGASDLSSLYTACSVRRDAEGHVLGLVRDGVRLDVRVGDGRWVRSELVGAGALLPVVASGGWTDDDTFVAEVRLVETPHSFRVTARRRGEDADLVWRMAPLNGADPLWSSVRPAP